jgi:demethylmenaquinone methyltransferase/2-methoxy-6-polyprenyl-1,4-benzoquinol methylase
VALSEMRRVLARGGRALVLEFSLPGNAAMRDLYLLYFRHVLPRLGAAVSGDAKAYRYLNQTVETFPYGEAFLDLMRAAGFRSVSAAPLTFGIATLYTGDA